MKIAGAVLVLLGFVSLLGGIPYDARETVAQIGGLKVQASEKRRVNVPPPVAGLAILAGSAMWFGASRRSQS